MKIKAVSGLMLTLLLISMLTLAFNIQTVPARTLVHNIDTHKDFATIQDAIDHHLTLDGHTILVDSGIFYENVVVDKAVALIGENGSTTFIDCSGIGSGFMIETDNATISNFTIQNGGGGNAGVFVGGNFKYNVVSNNIIRSNKWCGIFLDSGSYNNTISGNIISDNAIWPDGFGLRLFGSDRNTITRNMILNNQKGISMDISSGNYLRNNEIAGNSFNLAVNGYSMSSYIHYIDTSNTVDGKTIYYWTNKHDMQIPDNAGYVAAVNSTNIVVKDLDVRNNGQGVLFAYTNSSLITKVNASNNVYAIHLYSSSNNTIVHNDLSNNNNGMYIYASSRFNTIISNTIASNNANGIYLFSSDNTFYHNNFVNNKKYQVQVGNYIDSWDDGYPSGGNYWSDYTDLDVYSGPDQTEPGSDGIWDHPYIIDDNNEDRYPLVAPWTPILGDVNGDGMVDASDLSDLSKAYGSLLGDANWDERCDCNWDGEVDASDLFDLSKNYGKMRAA